MKNGLMLNRCKHWKQIKFPLCQSQLNDKRACLQVFNDAIITALKAVKIVIFTFLQS